jgi:integrase
MRQIFNWGMDELVVNTNPASGIRARHKEEERETVLDNDQIRRFWNGFKGKDVSELTSIAAKLELVTGQRTSEIVQMPKDRLKLDDRPLYFLPETKNSSIHILPLSPLAVSLVKRAMELSGDSKHLFPSPLRGGKEPMKHDVVVQAIRRKRDELGFKFTSHDLRRTMNTELSSFGYDKDLRNRILNHQGTGGVNDKVYDWHHYEPEMRKALEQWGRHLEAILANEVQEDNVISMIRAAKKVG